MKTERHTKILEIINSKDIETQEELVEELKSAGIEVTQATVSRDIKKLKITKVVGQNGKSKYSVVRHTGKLFPDKIVAIFSQTIIDVQTMKNFVVIKTLSGSAKAAAEAADSLAFSGVIGTVAGNNTLFVITTDEKAALSLAKKIKNMISNQ
ncbi:MULTISPECIES: arginine repressor [Clostridium]|uniref:Arginine repressor n=4 Tax=Clostridium TaxID=1485 RepID=D8GPT4_CLOLD|nr:MULTISPECIES: arginine repressor [Clostridium]ADK13993.1 predicted arginine repressor [Clostridium ljungdahlii DSM 13528]AGY77222.1 arginine repressor [Clostridium autoethanogenum DSM 10061]ALU37365.1 Arginine repressor [Clostridium autoethanogenum DSM 10061]OAA87484.1 Arginine repressor [Clostridium ljungdahlii DSM 13528]OAA93620.1 Arginine repressor [Clostridium coskatii]